MLRGGTYLSMPTSDSRLHATAPPTVWPCRASSGLTEAPGPQSAPLGRVKLSLLAAVCIVAKGSAGMTGQSDPKATATPAYKHCLSGLRQKAGWACADWVRMCMMDQRLCQSEWYEGPITVKGSCMSCLQGWSLPSPGQKATSARKYGLQVLKSRCCLCLPKADCTG